MRIYKVTFSHDSVEQMLVATPDSMDAFKKVTDVAINQAKRIERRLQRQHKGCEPVDVESVEFIHEVHTWVGLDIKVKK